MPTLRSTRYPQLVTYVNLEEDEQVRVSFENGLYSTENAEVADAVADLPDIERVEDAEPALEVRTTAAPGAARSTGPSSTAAVPSARGKDPEQVAAEHATADPEQVPGGLGGLGASDGPPEGTVGDVLDWVAEDPDRAQTALEVEQAKDDGGRSTLVAKLEELAAE
jgi:hypothetical protein